MYLIIKATKTVLFFVAIISMKQEYIKHRKLVIVIEIMCAFAILVRHHVFEKWFTTTYKDFFSIFKMFFFTY